MSEPILTRNFKVIDIATNVSTNSAAIDISDCTIVGLQVFASGIAGAVAGSVKLQASSDGGSNWSDIGTAISIPAAFTNGITSLNNVPWSLIRVSFTALSGGGETLTNLKAYVVTKRPA